MHTSDDALIQDFAWRGSLKFLAWVVPPAISCAYLIAMTLGLNSQEGLRVTAVILPFIVLVFGILYPYAALRVLAEGALRHRPDDRPGERLQRILTLPWLGTCLTTCVAWTLGGLFFAIPVCVWFEKEMVRALMGALIAFCFGVVMSFPIGLSFERLLFPVALAEQREHPDVHPQGRGPFWPRQAWFLPFTFVASIVCTLLLSGCVMVVKMMGLRETLMAELRRTGADGAAEQLQGLGSAAFSDLFIALLWVAGLVLVLPTITTWLLARRQALSAGAVRRAIEGLASGKAAPPEWISTDEMGDLATGMNQVLSNLREIPRTLQVSATRLSAAGTHLRNSTAEQQESVARQAAALHEASVTSEEIKRTSQMAADRAETVLQVARRAEALGQRGEEAVDESLKGLSSIRQSVDAMQQRLARLADSTSQVGEITETVKDLADQSNLLAINAAIEAARSGEHGKGFAVVAREIRALADQSIQATKRIQGILLEITRGIRDAAAVGDQGAQQIAVGLGQMKASGDSLRELSQISQENSTAARQIAAAVTQQHAGFAQIFTAISDLTSIMDTTLKRIETTQAATGALELVSGEVAQMAQRFEVN